MSSSMLLVLLVAIMVTIALECVAIKTPVMCRTACEMTDAFLGENDPLTAMDVIITPKKVTAGEADFFVMYSTIGKSVQFGINLDAGDKMKFWCRSCATNVKRICQEPWHDLTYPEANRTTNFNNPVLLAGIRISTEFVTDKRSTRMEVKVRLANETSFNVCQVSNVSAISGRMHMSVVGQQMFTGAYMFLPKAVFTSPTFVTKGKAGDHQPSVFQGVGWNNPCVDYQDYYRPNLCAYRVENKYLFNEKSDIPLDDAKKAALILSYSDTQVTSNNPFLRNYMKALETIASPTVEPSFAPLETIASPTVEPSFAPLETIASPTVEPSFAPLET